MLGSEVTPTLMITRWLSDEAMTIESPIFTRNGTAIVFQRAPISGCNPTLAVNLPVSAIYRVDLLTLGEPELIVSEAQLLGTPFIIRIYSYFPGLHCCSLVLTLDI